MFKTNEGKLDRIVRVVVGIALLLGYALNSDGAHSWAYLIGIVPLATGLLGSCPLYTLLGINTCPMKK